MAATTKKTRKATVSKKMIKKIREAEKKRKSTSSYKKKKTIVPGPWSNINVDFDVKASLRLNQSMLGEIYGTYPRDESWYEPGWYPIIFNLVSKNMHADIEKHGLDKFLSACEKALNSADNIKKYGNIILLEVAVDKSHLENNKDRFISVRAKTNKKNISGFSAIRKGMYKILE
jgi:hypothetical protein